MMTISYHRLATRVRLIFFLAMATLLVILATSFTLITYQNQQTNTSALERELAQRAAITIGAHLDSLRAPLVDTARLRPNLLLATPDDQQTTLTNLLSQNSSYLELELLGDRGNVVATAARNGHHLESVEQDPERLAAFQAAQNNQAYLGQVHLTTTQEPYVAIGEPLTGGRGALIAWIDLRHVWDIVSSVRVGDSGYAYVLDAAGNLIAYGDPAPILAHKNPVQTNPGLRAHLQTTGGVGEYVGLNGVEVVGSHAPIASTDWVVVVETPLTEAYTILYRALGLIALLLIVGILLAALMARYLAARLLEPVELLREGAALIGAGHLDHKIVIETGDEIEELATDFNRMTQSLLRARTELEDWALELERRVQERTAQVVEQKEQLAVLEERQRVARELHDSITQALFTLTLTLESAQAFAKKDPSRVPTLVERAHQIAKSALAETRALISDLRPTALEQRGLADALLEQLTEISTRNHIPIEFQSRGITRLASAIEDALYRIALEAVNNAVNHAHATRILIELAQRDTAVTLIVTDDGAGFDSSAEYAGHYGLTTMRERARALGGKMQIESESGNGTTVRAVIPLEEKHG
jgi:signal transduction histidine kinase